MQLKSNIEQGLLVKPETASAQQKAESRKVNEEVKKPEKEVNEDKERRTGAQWTQRQGKDTETAC
ncbi:MAG TPA: hypothetical protein VJL89_02840 [Thermodesulfovibrionia bacterium]|nr:hypothetical protein [Thermodesulfovibrionia bacterium]